MKVQEKLKELKKNLSDSKKIIVFFKNGKSLSIKNDVLIEYDDDGWVFLRLDQGEIYSSFIEESVIKIELADD